MLWLILAFRRLFFWGVIFGAVVFAIKNFPDRFQEAAMAFREGRYDQAVVVWSKMARGGHAEAQYNLGALYAAGLGVPHSPEKAHDWFMKAADACNPAAEFEAGKDFEYGRGTEQDIAKAVTFIARSAENGYPPAQIDLGLRYLSGAGLRKNTDKALYWLQRATGPDRAPPVLYVGTPVGAEGDCDGN